MILLLRRPETWLFRYDVQRRRAVRTYLRGRWIAVEEAAATRQPHARPWP